MESGAVWAAGQLHGQHGVHGDGAYKRPARKNRSFTSENRWNLSFIGHGIVSQVGSHKKLKFPARRFCFLPAEFNQFC